MTDATPQKVSWARKFRHAFRGIRIGSRGQSSFFVHVPVACFVLAAASQLHVSALEWCVLVLCITIVLSAELFNAALESMARAITSEYDSHIRDALDIAASAVLIASLGASVIGAIILGIRLVIAMGWAPLIVG